MTIEIVDFPMMVIFHGYVSLPEGRFTHKTCRIPSFRRLGLSIVQLGHIELPGLGSRGDGLRDCPKVWGGATEQQILAEEWGYRGHCNPQKI
jgi:hypothetical protein